MKLLKGGVIVGHVPRHFSRVFSYLLLSSTRITATVIGARQNLRNNGLEVPCRYKLKGSKSSMMKIVSKFAYFFIKKNVEIF